MLTIDEAISICDGNYRRFYQIDVDCVDYISTKDNYLRSIVFRQPSYINYIRSGTVPEQKFFSKRILCEKIFLFIKHSSFIESIEDLYYIDNRSPVLFDKILQMTKIISQEFNETEIKVVKEIINALKYGKDLTQVEFENDIERGVFHWAMPFIYTFWTTQDENGLIRISTEETFNLLIHENTLLHIVQGEAIKYKKEIMEREIAKSKRKR